MNPILLAATITVWTSVIIVFICYHRKATHENGRENKREQPQFDRGLEQGW